MAASLNPAAPHHLPAFIPGPDGSDVWMTVMAVFLVGVVLGVGLLFLRLHTLPERIAHKSHKLQFEIVAVLGLLALFTHMHIFWVAGLILALLELPDFGTPLNRIAGSAEKLAGLEPGQGALALPHPAGPADDAESSVGAVRVRPDGPAQLGGAVPLPAPRAEAAASKLREKIHA